LQNQTPGIGDFVEFRGRPWLVEGIEDKGGDLSALKLSCISDDAQGEALEVACHVEISTQRLEDDMWSRVGRNGTDDAATFATYLRTLNWNTATAEDRHLFQALFRAGIRLDAYQLLSPAQGASAPMRRAVRARTNGSVCARQAVEAFRYPAQRTLTSLQSMQKRMRRPDDHCRRGYYGRSCGPLGPVGARPNDLVLRVVAVDAMLALAKQRDTRLDTQLERLKGRSA